MKRFDIADKCVIISDTHRWSDKLFFSITQIALRSICIRLSAKNMFANVFQKIMIQYNRDTYQQLHIDILTTENVVNIRTDRRNPAGKPCHGAFLTAQLLLYKIADMNTRNTIAVLVRHHKAPIGQIEIKS